MAEAYISSKILYWGRERLGYSIEKLANSVQVNPEKLEEWEKGEVNPTYRQAQRLAKALKIPFTYLFLSDPPEQQISIPDLRVITGHREQSLSVEFQDVFNSIRRKQDWYREYLISQNVTEHAFVGYNSEDSDPSSLAGDIKSALQIENDFFLTATSWSDYMTQLTKKVESIGVLVFRSGIVGNNTHRALNVDEFRGFALCDDLAPAIFINTKDSKAAQIFTLIHELAHIWIGQSGISDITSDLDTMVIDNEVERFCDKTAAEFLVPETEISTRWNDSVDIEDLIQQLARVFRVSTVMILRRGLELGTISRADYFTHMEIEKTKQLKDVKKRSGGDFNNNFAARNGHLLINAVFESVLEGKTLIREAATILDTKSPTLASLAENFRFAS